MKTLLSISTIILIAVLTFFSPSQPPVAQPLNLSASKYVVVQFNAAWHQNEDVKGLETFKWFNYQTVDIAKFPALKTKHKIVTLPTVIFYKDGLEVKRWEAGVSMKASFTAQQINTELQRLK